MRKFLTLTALVLATAASAQYVTPKADQPDVVTLNLGAAYSNGVGVRGYATVGLTEVLAWTKNGQVVGTLSLGSEPLNTLGFVQGEVAYKTVYDKTNYTGYAKVRRNLVTNCNLGCNFGNFGTVWILGVEARR